VNCNERQKYSIPFLDMAYQEMALGMGSLVDRYQKREFEEGELNNDLCSL